MVGHPSIQDYKNIIKINVINNFQVTVEDIDICEKIFGLDIYMLKGSTVITKHKAVVNYYNNITQE